jgi:putative DNA primase/helicase
MSKKVHSKTTFSEHKQERMCEQAIVYARRGWHVLPTSAKSKKPINKKGSHGATIDEDQIIDWWNEHPTANIGVATGEQSGFFVVDLDIKDGKNGAETLSEYFGEEIESIDTEKHLIGKTATGGIHLLYKWDNERPVNNAQGVLPGVDIRGTGGYVVVAPSGRFIDKQWIEYRWNNEDLPIPEAPEWVWELTEKSSKKQKEGVNLEQALKGIPKGSRDDDLFKIACMLQSRGVTFDTAKTFVVMLAERCNPPFATEEAVKKVKYAYTRYQESEQKRDIINKLRTPFWKKS